MEETVDENSDLDLYNSLCEKGHFKPIPEIVRQLEDPYNKPFSELYFSGVTLNTKTYPPICDLIENCSTIERISFSESKIKPSILMHILFSIVKNGNVNEIDLQNSHLSSSYILRSLEHIRNSPSLTWLDLSGNDLGSQGVGDEVSKCVDGSNLRLERINLSRTSFSISNSPVICDYIATSTTLGTLILQENNMGVEDVELLCKCLLHNNSLGTLDLSSNQFGDKACEHIANLLLVNSCLTFLTLWDVKMTPRGLDHIVNSLIFQEQPSLQALEIGKNKFQKSGAFLLKDLIHVNDSLHFLGIAACGIDSEGAVAIAESIADNACLVEVDIRGNEVGIAGLMAISRAVQYSPGLNHVGVDTVGKISTKEEVEIVRSLMESIP